MTFQEFRNQARAIATELNEQRGLSAPRCTNCELNYWDYEDGRSCIIWDIWDSTAHRHFEAASAEGALALYRAEVLAGRPAEDQLAEVGTPSDGDTEAA